MVVCSWVKITNPSGAEERKEECNGTAFRRLQLSWGYKSHQSHLEEKEHTYRGLEEQRRKKNKEKRKVINRE